MTCFTCLYNCLPTCMQSQCCAPTTATVIPINQSTQTAAASTISTTPPPTPHVTTPAMARVTAVRPPTPGSMTEAQGARIAVINARLTHYKGASTEMVSMNTFLGEKRDRVT